MDRKQRFKLAVFIRANLSGVEFKPGLLTNGPDALAFVVRERQARAHAHTGTAALSISSREAKPNKARFFVSALKKNSSLRCFAFGALRFDSASKFVLE